MTVLSVLLVQADSWTCAYLQSPDSQTVGRIVPKGMTALDASFCSLSHLAQFSRQGQKAGGSAISNYRRTAYLAAHTPSWLPTELW